MRPGIEVRAAVPGDLADLVALCLTARGETSVGPAVCTSDAVTLAQQLGAFTAVPGGTVLVACVEDAVVGMVLGRLVGPNPFTPDVSLAVEAVYVSPAHRRRGVGHALMESAAEVAATAGAVQVFATPLPGARGMNRFLVQLGFTPAGNHRATTTAALQRRLAQDPSVPRRAGTRGLEDLIARRRRSRSAAARSGVGRAAGGKPEAGRAGADRAAAATSAADGAAARAPSTPPALPAGALAEEDQAGGRAAITKQVRRAVQTRRDVASSTTIS